MIKAVAWDIDGTLLDSEPLHLRSLMLVCENHNVDISDLPDEQFVGVNLYGVWQKLRERFPANLKFHKWAAQINDYYLAHRSNLTIVEHATEVIRRLNVLGISQVAVSNSNRLIVDINLSVIEISEFISFSISLDDVERGKPDPFPYQLATKNLGLRPDEILAVEDSYSGIVSARAAGLKIAAFNVSGNFETATDFTIASLKEVISIVETGRLMKA